MKKRLPQKEPRIPFTPQGYKKLLAEQEQLRSERPEAVEHLRKAREMGDLSENGYYKASRARLSFLDARLRRTDRLVRLAIVVESKNGSVADLGSRITITDGAKVEEFTLVGGYESDPSNHTISVNSPLGKALLGKKEQEQVIVHAPAGDRRYTIVKVSS